MRRHGYTLIVGLELAVGLGSIAEAQTARQQCYAELATFGVSTKVLEEPLHYQVEIASTLGAYLCDFARSRSLHAIRTAWFSDQVEVDLGPYLIRFDKVKAGLDTPGMHYERKDSGSVAPVKYAVVAVETSDDTIEITNLSENLSILLSLHQFAVPYAWD